MAEKKKLFFFLYTRPNRNECINNISEGIGCEVYIAKRLTSPINSRSGIGVAHDKSILPDFVSKTRIFRKKKMRKLKKIATTIFYEMLPNFD